MGNCETLVLLFLISVGQLGFSYGAAPVWTNPLTGATFNVNENEASGYVVESNLQASGGDGGLTFGITSITPTSTLFTIANTNQLHTNGALDTETQASYTVFLSVNDGVNADVTISVTITITDVNDVAPVVTATPSTQTLTEGVATDALVATISHTDGDVTTAFQTATYTIDSVTPTSAIFAIVNTNELKTTAALPLYTVASSYVFSIKATDTGNAALTGLTTVTLNVASKPTFNEPALATYSIPESASPGDSVFPFAAVDPDTSPSAVTVTIDSQPASNPFTISGTDIVVNTGATFDFETTNSMTVTLRASDGDATHDVTKVVTVAITNVNEAPVFTPSTASSPVMAENHATGTSVYTAVAVDPEGDTLTYAITTGNTNNDFQINSASGLVTYQNSPLSGGSYTLTITATDGGPLSDTLTLAVTVNKAPVITLNTATAVPENTAIGTTVYTIVATDADVGDTLTYSVTPVVAGAFANTLDKVTVGALFDYETGPTSYVVTLGVTDSVNDEVTASLTIPLSDVDDVAPVLTVTAIATEILEASPAGTQVASFAFTDGDSTAGSFPASTVTITAGDVSGRFTIVGDKVQTADNLIDYTTDPSFTLTLTVTDSGGNTDTATYTVNIETQPIVTIGTTSPHSVSETAAIGDPVFTLTATDEDGIPSVTLTYTVVAPPILTNFQLVGNVLQVSAALDYDTTPPPPDVSIDITVSDGKHTVTVPTQVVSIADVNEAPAFTAPFTYELPENLPVGHTVFTVAATDPEGITALTYSLTDANFAIGSSSGAVTITTQMDKTSAATHTLSIGVSDGVASASDNFIVNVHEPPTFTTPPAVGGTASVAESASVGTSILRLTATDSDGDGVSYSIDSQTPANAVALAVDGIQLNTALAFDFEGGTTSYTITLVATDDSQWTLTSTTVLTLTITNSNEAPTCPSTALSASVVENTGAQANIAQATATDIDAGDTALLVFSITSGSTTLFTIDAGTGQVSTQGSLFHSTGATHALVITATDTGSLTCTLSLNVAVDTVPTITAPTDGYIMSLPENTPVGATAIYTIVASDVDGDTVTMTLTNAASVPQIGFDTNTGNPDTAIITVAQALDFETTPTLVLNFHVTDGTPNTATASMTISVTDSNDQAPVFGSATYTGEVAESAAAGTTIATVAATDGDTSLDNNNVISFSITGTSPFSIGATSGEITLTSAGSLNYATTPSYALTVVAKDRSGAAGFLSAEATVNIAVKTAPVFTSATTLTVSESTAPDTSVFQIVATDADASGSITYSLLSQTPTSPAAQFVLDPTSGATTGNIKTGAVQLDLDVTTPVTSFVLNVQASDGTFSTTSDVTVTIGYANDIAPVFNPTSYTVTVQETVAVGSSVAKVTATDADSTTAHNTITYSIPGGSKFVMASSPSDEINLATALTRAADHPVTLTVTATDGVNTDTATLTVNVKTLPVFTAPATGASVTLAEDTVADGTATVFTVTVTDADGDTLTMSVNSPTTGQFIFDGITKVVKLATPLDYETDPSIPITFKATDSDGNEVVSETLTLIVGDVNDVVPTFTSANTATVKSDAAVGTSVLQLAAVDNDGSPPNNQIASYTITSGNAAGDFIMSTSGLITVNQALDIAARPTATLGVRVIDSGTSPGPLSGDATVTITLVVSTDAVITSPATGGTAAVSIPENLGVGGNVFSVVATDTDNDQLMYTIKAVSATGVFTLSQSTGVLTLSTALNYEATQSYTVEFYVDDDDSNTANKQSSGVLTVTVTNVNDPPVFSTRYWPINVWEHVTMVVTIAENQATNDESSQSLTYSIVAGDPLGRFTVDNTGTVKTTSAGLSRDEQTNHLLAIQAVDNGTPPRSDSWHLEVRVLPYPDSAGPSGHDPALPLLLASALFVILLK